ncbi:MAG: pentapeptide repeat-containing protein, partial [Shewanella sp.]
EFEDCDFHDCHFSESTWRKCQFIDCRFVRCNLSLVKVPLCQFSGVAFVECKLVGIDWTRAAWSPLSFATPFSFAQCILNDGSFLGLTLDEITIEACKAHDVDFREGSFKRANFTHTDFSHSLFGHTVLLEADFSEASNYDIDIFNNKIKGAKFSRDQALRLLHGLDIELVD